MTNYYHSGVALAKKKGKDIHIVETPTGIGDLLPVATAGTAYPRQLRYRFGDVVNVKDFGAQGDGTTDDTAAIMRAMQFAYRHPKSTVFFPRGEYLKSDAICLPSQVTLASLGATIKNVPGNTSRWITTGLGFEEAALIAYDSLSDISIEGFIFQGNGETLTASVSAGYCTGVTIRNCVFRDIGTFHAVEIMSCKNVLIEDCRFEGFVEGSGTNYAEAIQFDASYVSEDTPPGPRGSGNGLPTRHAIIRNCTFTKSETNGYFMTGVGSHWAVAEGKIQDVTVENCYFDHCSVAGVSFKGVDDVSIVGCSFNECARSVYAREFRANAACNADGSLSGKPIGNARWTIDRCAIVHGNSSAPAIVIDEREAPVTSSEDLAMFAGLTIKNTSVLCVGAATDVSKNCFDINRVDGLSIQGCTFNLNNGTGYAFSTNVIYAVGCKNAFICDNTYVADGARQQAVTVDKNGAYFPTSDFVIKGNVVVSAKRGFNVSNCSNVVVVGNRVTATEIGVNLLGCQDTCVGGNAIVAPTTINTNATTKDFAVVGNAVRASTAAFSGSPTWEGAAGALMGDLLIAQNHRISASARGQLKLGTADAASTNDVLNVFFNFDAGEGRVYPCVDGTTPLGGSSYRWSQLFAATATINTSDARCKENVTAPDDALMRAWGKVGFKVFQFKDAVEKKGGDARIHVGVIAQEVKAAFESEGLDASRYGLFCHDAWEDEYEDVTVVDQPEVTDEDGNITTPEVSHVEKRLVTAAGDRYGIRYEEALALECAYQRWRLAQIEARLS